MDRTAGAYPNLNKPPIINPSSQSQFERAGDEAAEVTSAGVLTAGVRWRPLGLVLVAR
jgi:hypothetical protein